MHIKQRMDRILTGSIGVAFSVAMIFGKQLDQNQTVQLTSARTWIGITILAVVAGVLIDIAWKGLAHREAVKLKNPQISNKVLSWFTGLSHKKYCLVIAVFLFVCWLPSFLGVFPGFFVYDAMEEYMQVATATYTAHHPVMHVLLLGGAIRLIAKITGSYNMGIAVYTILQMVVVSAGLAYTVTYLRKRAYPICTRIISILYYALFPVITMYALCSTKDTLFTVSLLVFCVLLQELLEDKESFLKNKYKIIGLMVTMLGTMILRHNGYYAIIVFMPVLVILMRKQWKRFLILLLIVFTVYGLYTGPFYKILHVAPGGKQEMLTVPIQQLARVHYFNKEVFSEEELQTLYEVLPQTALGQYRPKLSDPVKIHFNGEQYSENKSKYNKLWINIGLRKPAVYLNAWLVNSYGFWYPFTVLDAYKGNQVFTFTYEDSSYFGYEVEFPGERKSLIPAVDAWYQKISLDASFQKIPMISLFFAPAFYFWVFVFIGGYHIYRRRWSQTVILVPIFLIWLTALLGPAALVRYVLILFFAFPIILVGLLPKPKTKFPNI